jgi:prepilin-type N-terminal cleavage/methylation domain-containing protein
MMKCKVKNRGFSLTEVLLSVGVLAVGMIFIAGVFPVGIHYTTIAIEQTKAAIVADEAFAKVRLYAIGDPNRLIDLNTLRTDELRPDGPVKFDDIFPAAENIDPNEFAYPSAGTDISEKRYYWSALCRQVSTDSRRVQVTVFVCRKIGRQPQYYDPGGGFIDWPRPFEVGVSRTGPRELRITGGDERFITDGCIIVNDETGRRYRVLERYATEDDTVLLDADWVTGSYAWVVPPPAAPGTTASEKICSGRDPCIAVYQRTMSF